MEFICMAWMDSMMSTSWQTNKVPIPNWASFHPSPASHEHHSHDQNKHCLQIPTEDQRNHPAKLCAMAWAMATTGSGIFSNKGCEQACKNYILKQLGLFPGIDIIVYWVLKIQVRNITADSHLVPFINIKYLFHSIPTSTPIRTFSHRLKSTWNRILNETDNATWLLGHLELWGIFLFNTSMLFYLSCSADEHWFLWPTAHLNAVMLLSSSCFQFSICNQTLSPTQAKTRTSSSGPRTSMYVRGPLLLVPKNGCWVLMWCWRPWKARRGYILVSMAGANRIRRFQRRHFAIDYSEQNPSWRFDLMSFRSRLCMTSWTFQ